MADPTTTPMPDTGYPRSVHIPIEDAVQAVVAALGFGQDAGLAALGSYQADEHDRVSHTAIDTVEVYPGAMNMVSMTVGARRLLALAQTEYAVRMMPMPVKYTGLIRYDLTDAQPSRTIGFGLGKGA